MAMFTEVDIWEFTATVAPVAGLQVGVAVEFTTATAGNPIPNIQKATADNGVVADDPRTTYVGVTLTAGAQGERVSVRPWSAGTMPCLALVSTDAAAGLTWKWDGDKMVRDDTDAATAINMSALTADAVNSQIVEFMVLKGGRE